jgi:Cof subfamily protein (haloacid dehalogenase superfamily)
MKLLIMGNNQIANLEKVRALSLDLDGTTLMPDTTMGERTVNVLKKLLSQGMQVLFCTGRAVEAAERFRAAIGAEGPMVFFNGAEVVDVPSGRILSAILLEADMVNFCIEMSREINAHFQIFLPAGIITGRDRWEALVMDKLTPEGEMYSKHTGIIPVIQDLKTTMSSIQGCVKGMFICEPEKHNGIRSMLKERFGSKIYAARTLPTFLEIMNANVSKGEGLKIALKHRGLNASEVLAIGDEENDLPMFDAAGQTAAPANARQNVRERADYIFGSNETEGIAAFLEKNFLKL